jgi:hypothetical protein
LGGRGRPSAPCESIPVFCGKPARRPPPLEKASASVRPKRFTGAHDGIELEIGKRDRRHAADFRATSTLSGHPLAPESAIEGVLLLLIHHTWQRNAAP